MLQKIVELYVENVAVLNAEILHCKLGSTLKHKLESLLQKRKATIKSHTHQKASKHAPDTEDAIEAELDE